MFFLRLSFMRLPWVVSNASDCIALWTECEILLMFYKDLAIWENRFRFFFIQTNRFCLCIPDGNTNKIKRVVFSHKELLKIRFVKWEEPEKDSRVARPLKSLPDPLISSNNKSVNVDTQIIFWLQAIQKTCSLMHEYT